MFAALDAGERAKEPDARQRTIADFLAVQPIEGVCSGDDEHSGEDQRRVTGTRPPRADRQGEETPASGTTPSEAQPRRERRRPREVRRDGAEFTRRRRRTLPRIRVSPSARGSGGVEKDPAATRQSATKRRARRSRPERETEGGGRGHPRERASRVDGTRREDGESSIRWFASEVRSPRRRPPAPSGAERQEKPQREEGCARRSGASRSATQVHDEPPAYDLRRDSKRAMTAR